MGTFSLLTQVDKDGAKMRHSKCWLDPTLLPAVMIMLFAQRVAVRRIADAQLVIIEIHPHLEVLSAMSFYFCLQHELLI